MRCVYIGLNRCFIDRILQGLVTKFGGIEGKCSEKDSSGFSIKGEIVYFSTMFVCMMPMYITGDNISYMKPMVRDISFTWETP